MTSINGKYIGLLLIILTATFINISSGSRRPSQLEKACRQKCGHRFVNKREGGVAGRFFGIKETEGWEERTSWESIEEVGYKVNVPFVYEGGKRNVTRTFGSAVQTHKDTIQIGII